jgi:hypothetical protein
MGALSHRLNGQKKQSKAARGHEKAPGSPTLFLSQSGKTFSFYFFIGLIFVSSPPRVASS